MSIIPSWLVHEINKHVALPAEHDLYDALPCIASLAHTYDMQTGGERGPSGSCGKACSTGDPYEGGNLRAHWAHEQ